MQILPYNVEGYKLLHDGMLTFSEMQQNGIMMDVKHLKSEYKRLGKEIKDILLFFNDFKEVQLWKKKYKKDFNIDSDEQLGDILFNEMGHEPSKLTDSGNPSVDQEALKNLDLPLTNEILKYRKLFKIKNTYLKGLIKETHNGMIHPFMNLHTARTFRSCVAKGTKIMMPAYFKRYPNGVPIEKVKAGDYVFCFDDNLQPAIRKVLWAGKTGHREVIRVHWKSRSRTGYIDVTPEHLIRKTNGEYEEAQNLLKKDLRSESESHHVPKHRVLAARRLGDELLFAGVVRKNGHGILEHRFIYEHFHNVKLKDDEILHHINHNHLDHRLTNLEKHTLSSHSTLHAKFTINSETAKENNRRMIKEKWASGQMNHIIKRGKDSPNYIHLTKYQLLRALAKVAGRPTKLPYSFSTVKERLLEYGFDISSIQLRYDMNGKYISRGRFKSAAHLGISKMQTVFGKGYYAIQKLARLYKIDVAAYWGNQTGVFKKNNHVITKIEWLGDVVDVYDLEVEECHNFIANEICVHNSSSLPNVQNMPTRDPVAGKIIRKAFIPRKDHYLFCADYGGVEVKAAALYHQDPTMLSYLNDPLHADMHSDFACLLFKLDEIDQSVKGEKLLRACTKNSFTFPQFYGDYYGNNAIGIWKWLGFSGEKIKRTKGPEIKTGITIGQHLINNRIKTFNQFKEHVKKIEQNMWNKRFPVYRDWKEAQYNYYLKNAYITSLSGFIFSGMMDKNAVINYPIQGLAFHFLLWSCIRLNKLLKRNKLKTKLIFQVHDEAVLDVPKNEYKVIMKLLKQVMIHDLKEHWNFINVPLELEVECSELNGNWFETNTELHYIQ